MEPEPDLVVKANEKINSAPLRKSKRKKILGPAKQAYPNLDWVNC